MMTKEYIKKIILILILFNLFLQQNEEEPQNEENSQKLTSVENANFKNKRSVINSPRTLQACFKLGIEPSELYQITMDEFKLLNPDVRHLPQDMIQFRYDAEEKYRNDSIEQVKAERQKIIDEEANSDKDKENKNEENKEAENQNQLDEKMKKLKEEEEKALEKIKKKQTQDIESMIENQINNELRIRQTIVKEKIQIMKK